MEKNDRQPAYSVDDILAELAEKRPRREAAAPRPPASPAPVPEKIPVHLPPDLGTPPKKWEQDGGLQEGRRPLSVLRGQEEAPKRAEGGNRSDGAAGTPPPRPAGTQAADTATRVMDIPSPIPAKGIPAGPEEEPAPSGEMDGQIRLDDYVEMPPLPENETYDLESDLKRIRREKVAEFEKRRRNQPLDFKLSGEEEEDNDPAEEPELFEEEELEDFGSYSETEAVQNELSYRRRTGWIGCLLSLSLELVLVWLALMTHIAGAPPMETYLYIGLHAFLLLFMMLVNHQTVGGGLFSLVRMQADGDSAAALSSLAALIHTLVQFFRPDGVSSGWLELLAPVAGLSLLLAALGRQARVLRVCANFRFVSYPGDKFEAKHIDDVRAAEEIGRAATAIGEPQVAYFKRAAFLSRFLENSYAPDGSIPVLRVFMPFLMLAAILLGLGYGLVRGDWWMALTVFVSTLCLSAPAAMPAVHFPMLWAAKKALERGGMISGWNAVKTFGRLHGVVVDAADLFPGESVLLHGIKTFSGARIDEAILDAAAVSIQAGGPLAAVFRRVIEDRLDMLPAVESLVYEQDMGLSGWVGGRRVLVGNRQLLENHGVDVPSRDYELRYTKNERRLVYLSTAGELSAMFVISYTADEGIAEALHSLEKAHITLLVRTCDPNITEELICNTLDIDAYYVDLMNNITGRTYANLLERQEDEAQAVLASNGRIEGMAAALAGCGRLRLGAGLGLAAQIAAAGLGIALNAVLAFHGHTVFPALYTLIYQLAAAVFSWILPCGKRI